jgi:pimeloyl-ACP methyl ester carboxylesterase
LIFLAGLGGTAHVFDHFAPQFIEKYHVYGITRRGYGASDKPEPTMVNYSADRLGDDVLAVMDALKIEKPILVGHSLGGEELSSVGSRFPDKVAGLVYLDAGFAYGFYAPGNVIPLGSNLTIDANDISRKVQQFNEMGATPQALAALDDLIRTNLPQFKTDLLATQKMVQQQQRNLSNATSPPPPETPQMKTANAILNGEEKYTDIKAPILAIFAAPKSISPKAPTAIRTIAQLQNTAEEAQAKKFQAGNPTARVVLIANSRHDVFNSNTSDVIREMNSFLDHLN